jgi:hypothetical protein
VPASDTPDDARELRNLSVEVARLVERLRLVERDRARDRQRIDRLQRELDGVTRADEIAAAVASTLDKRRKEQGRNISTVWMKLGIVALIISIPVSTASLLVQVIG